MKNVWIVASMVVGSIFVLGISMVQAGGAPCAISTNKVATAGQVAGPDINKDGTPDVTYYHDGQKVVKVEADTNYDGKPDATVHIENGNFKSAEVDTNYDGVPDKQFTNADEFKKWVNAERPDFQSSLGWANWSTPPIKF